VQDRFFPLCRLSLGSLLTHAFCYGAVCAICPLSLRHIVDHSFTALAFAERIVH
jgi:hypothetical protein